jgi:hypothetical protein
MVGPTSVLGTHDNRVRWAGSEVDVRAAGVRSLTTLTLSLHGTPGKFRGESRACRAVNDLQTWKGIMGHG